MRTLCPHCGAEDLRCEEKLYACRARGEARRKLYAVANGSELEMLRAENEALRAALAKHARARVELEPGTHREIGRGE